MPDFANIDVIRTVLKRHGFTFEKSMGQNFLTDPTVCPQMAELCGADVHSGVIEIGAGIGVLTKELSARAKKVVSIELDTRLLPVLAETLTDCRNTEIINADVLKTDLRALLDEHLPGMPVFVCANLPYYITSPVLLYLLENELPLKAITVMVQREAADRLCAAVGTRDAGAITVAVNYYATVEKLFDVPRTAFMPAPNVDSAVIRLTLRDAPPIAVEDKAFFFDVVRAAFSQRRKTAANGLSSGLSLPKDAVNAALTAAALSPTVRAEALTMEQLAALTGELYKLK